MFDEWILITCRSRKVERQGTFGLGAAAVSGFCPPEGKHLGTISVPERVGNLAWGDADGKTLYVVASTSVFRIKTKVGGVKP
jgi:gluconolactonase